MPAQNDKPLFSKLKKKEKESRRRLIMETAEEIFREKGLEGVTLRNVADQVGVSPGTIYTYFRNKEELLLYILNDNLDSLEKGLEAAFNLPDPVSCLSALAWEYRRYYLRLGRFVKVVDFLTKYQSSQRELSPMLMDEIRDKVAGLMRRAETRLAADDMKPIIKDLPPARAVAVLWAIGHGVMELSLPSMLTNGSNWFQFEQLLEDVLYLMTDIPDIE